MNERRVVFQCLHQIRRQLVFKQHGHRAMRLKVTRTQRLAFSGVTKNDIAEPLFQVLERSGQTENRHHFGGNHNIETVFARIAVGGATQRHHDVTQCAVVHVHHALPSDATRIDAEFVTVRNVIVDHRRQQVIGQANRTEVAGKMQIDVFHRHHLRITTTRRAALHAEDRPQARFAQADHRFLADFIQRIAKTNRSRGLAFAGRRRADGRNQNQLAFFLVFQAVDVFERNLGFVMTIRHQMFIGDAELLGNFGNP